MNKTKDGLVSIGSENSDMRKLTGKKFKFISDPCHGWLEVDRELLKILDIENEISGYSYQNFGKVYLEEDCDASIFKNKWQEKTGLNLLDYVIIKDQNTNAVCRLYRSYEVE